VRQPRHRKYLWVHISRQKQEKQDISAFFSGGDTGIFTTGHCKCGSGGCIKNLSFFVVMTLGSLPRATASAAAFFYAA
jgi:hypothetical protein